MKFISQILTAASGSIRGCVFTRGRSGAVIRGKSIPINPGSSQQNVMRAALATLVARWTSTLTPAQRTAWNTWAFNSPQTDALGQSILLTGQNAYVKMNAPRLQIGSGFVNTPPILFAGTSLSPPILTIADVSAQTLTFSFDNTDEWANQAQGALLLYQGRPQNQSVKSFKGPYRYRGVVQGDAFTPPSSPQSLSAIFPFELNQSIHVQFRALSEDGRISSLVRSSIISVA